MLALLLSALFTLVELNCENLFDTEHDSLKQDMEFTPRSDHHWTRTRYWRKLNHISKEIIAMGEDSVNGWQLPDLVALCEVENDSVMHYSLRVTPVKGMRPTRDILYACGMTLNNDTLHVFTLHAPSRSGGERPTRPHRMAMARRLAMAIDSIRTLHEEAQIIIAGDFNDYDDGPTLEYLSSVGLINVSAKAKGSHGAKGTYRYRGEWRSLDHILCSPRLAGKVTECFIGDPPFLLEEEPKYGGYRPRRTYQGPKYQPGYSDHLPLVVRIATDPNGGK